MSTPERPRSCWLEVDLGAIRTNLNYIRGQLADSIDPLCVVKADAYGHGAEFVAKTLENEGVGFLGVATLEEGLKLRQFGIQSDILIMGHMPTFVAEQIVREQFVPMVYSFRLLNAINQEARQQNTVYPIHLKVDTGMGRLGLLPDDVPEFIEQVKAKQHVTLEGVATHLAEAGEDREYTREQIDEFETIREHVQAQQLDVQYWHGMNSAAIFSDHHSFGNLARPGIALYGYPPHDQVTVPDLQPVLQVKSKMADYKQLAAGKGVSYGRMYQPDEPTWIGVLPVGYADGYSRALSNGAHVLKGGDEKPVLGAVCMDMTIIKLDEHDDPEQTVTIMGQDNGTRLWADKIAEWNNTIPYEILSGFSPRLPRLYFENGQQVGIKTEHEVKQT